MKIYITRHGETEWNKLGKLQGWKDSPLTKTGIENAKKLGEHLRDVDFDYIYTSPQGRAFETAKLIRGDRDKKIIKTDFLREIGLGKWEGMTYEEVETVYREEHYNFWNRPSLYKPLGGESFDELLIRAENIIKEIVKKKADNILLVSHGIAIKALYAVIQDTDLKDFWKSPVSKNNSLTLVENLGGRMKILLEEDTSHL